MAKVVTKEDKEAFWRDRLQKMRDNKRDPEECDLLDQYPPWKFYLLRQGLERKVSIPVRVQEAARFQDNKVYLIVRWPGMAEHITAVNPDEVVPMDTYTKEAERYVLGKCTKSEDIRYFAYWKSVFSDNFLK